MSVMGALSYNIVKKRKHYRLLSILMSIMLVFSNASYALPTYADAEETTTVEYTIDNESEVSDGNEEGTSTVESTSSTTAESPCEVKAVPFESIKKN
ncbi:MAG: hypothetical protein IJ468_01625 [Lachnospiraceae bacterium]|nr:hypothetical protein [Lachnospiraceae bacterium]